MSTDESTIDSLTEVNAYIAKLRYAIDSGCEIVFMQQRHVDSDRGEKYTNRYTVSNLFPNEQPSAALKRELKTLTKENYIRSVIDRRYPDKDRFYEFGKYYSEGAVYIKTRISILDHHENCSNFLFVMSFHFAERPFTESTFPYKAKNDETTVRRK